jgi:signal transduction histidine kinase
LREEAKGSTSRNKPGEPKKTILVYTGVVYRYHYCSLIENAFDVIPQGGIHIIINKKSMGNVEIALKDTVSDVSENVMENLCKPSQTTKANGLGLGLAICKRIVNAHKRSQSMKCEVGRDTTLTMQLPITPVEVKQK